MSYHERKVWAIQHRAGVSLIRARNGPRAIRRCAELFGPSLGPYKVLRNQDQQIIFAKLNGAEVK